MNSCLSLEELIEKDSLFVDGDWVESKDQDPNGDVRLVQLADIGDGKYKDRSNRFLTSKKAAVLGCTFLKQGDVLVARMPDPLGRACIFPGDSKKSVTVVDVCIIRTPNVDHRWLMYMINSPQVRAQIEKYQSGSTRKRISRTNLAKIFLPAISRCEQEKTVLKIEELLSQLDAGVTSLEEVRANLARYKASVLKAACEGRLVPQQPGDEPSEALLRRLGVQPLAGEGLGSLPEGWCWARVGDLAKQIQYGTSEKADLDTSGIPVIRMGNIQNGEIDFTNLKYLSQDKVDDGLLLENRDLIFNRTNSAELVGKTAVYMEQDRKITFASYLIRVKLLESCSPEFVSCYINSWYGRQYIASVVSQQVGQANVNGTKLANMPIPLPPLKEQQKIVLELDRRLSTATSVNNNIEVGLARATRLRQAVLKAAFEGRLV